jgi:hypothetical protein
VRKIMKNQSTASYYKDPLNKMHLEKEVHLFSFLFWSGFKFENIILKFLGIYELMLIQKKSMTIADYRKKVSCFNEITEKKSMEEVEELVKQIL